MKINNQQLIKNHVYLFGIHSKLIESKYELEICLHQDLVTIARSDIELFEKIKNCKFDRIVKDEKSFTSIYFSKNQNHGSRKSVRHISEIVEPAESRDEN